MSTLEKTKGMLKTKKNLRIILALAVLSVAILSAFTLSHLKKDKSIELYGLSVKQPRGIDRVEVLDGGGEAVLYRGERVAGGVKYLQYSLADCDGITVEKDAKQIGQREYSETEDMHVIKVNFERPYSKDSGKTGTYTEKHICLVPVGGESVYDFYEVAKVAKAGTAEFMQKNWKNVKPVPRPGEGWNVLSANMAAMEEELRIVEMGGESEYTNLYKVTENTVAEIVGHKNKEDVSADTDLSKLYYYQSGENASSVLNSDKLTVFGDMFFSVKDNKCIAVRSFNAASSGANIIWAPIGWREYRAADIPPMELVKDGELLDEKNVVYNERIYQTEIQDGKKTRVRQKRVSRGTELLDAFSQSMFEGKPCSVKITDVSVVDGILERPSGWNTYLLVYDGKKAVAYNLLLCLDGKYRCYMPEEFEQMVLKTGSGYSYYDLQWADTSRDRMGLFYIYSE